MTINVTKWNMIQRSIGRISRELGVGIYDFETFGELKPTEWGINWSAQGTKSIDEAKAYIENMNKAMKLAEFLNGQEIIVDWTLDKTDINDDNREYFINQNEMLYERIKEMKDIVWNF